MNFLFHTHNEPNMLTVHVDEELPTNRPDILPTDEDSLHERAEKAVMAANTHGGYVIRRDKAHEEWVSEPYKNLFEVAGIQAVGLVTCYEIVVHKGELFDWEVLKPRLVHALASGLKGEVVGKVDEAMCPDCFGPSDRQRRAAHQRRPHGEQSQGQQRPLRADESLTVDHQAIKSFMQRTIGKAQQLGLSMCVVVDTPDGGVLCAEMLPQNEDNSNLASAAMSGFHDRWMEARTSQRKAAERAAAEQAEEPS